LRSVPPLFISLDLATISDTPGVMGITYDLSSRFMTQFEREIERERERKGEQYVENGNPVEIVFVGNSGGSSLARFAFESSNGNYTICLVFLQGYRLATIINFRSRVS